MPSPYREGAVHHPDLLAMQTLIKVPLHKSTIGLHSLAVIDSAVTQLCDRFDKEKPGLKTYLSLENMLLTGTIDEQLCSIYPELASTNIAVQLPMFRNSYTFDTVSDCQKLL